MWPTRQSSALTIFCVRRVKSDPLIRTTWYFSSCCHLLSTLLKFSKCAVFMVALNQGVPGSNPWWCTRKKHTIGVLFSTKFAAARQVKWLRREMHLWCVKYPLTRMLKGKFHFTESAAHYFTICVKQIISHRAVREIFHYKIINMCYQ